MNIHQKYRSEKLDDIFCYFMKTILRLEKTGIGSLPVEFEGEEPVKGFLMLSMRLLTEAEPPETTRLILQSEYDYIVQSLHPDCGKILELQLIKNLSEHMRFDENDYEYLLQTENLWQDKANAYACRTFYGNLPPKVQKRGGYDKILSHMPEEMLDLDNY